MTSPSQISSANDYLLNVLVPQSKLSWVAATVTVVTSDFGAPNDLTVSIAGDVVSGVMVLSSYVPVVGDVAQCLIIESMGMIAIGKINKLTTEDPIPAPTPIVIQPLSHSGNRWTYKASDLLPFLDLTGHPQASMEISLVSPSPVDVGVIPYGKDVNNVYVPAAMAYYPNDPVPGGSVLTWVPLPVGWIDVMSADHSVDSIDAFQDGHETDVWPWAAGSGQLRFTALF